MELKLIDEFKSKKSDYTSKTYQTDGTVQQDNFCDLLEKLEDENTRFYSCMCSTYDENGTPMSPTFHDLEKLRNCYFENSAVSFMANFIDRKTEDYKFSVLSSINANRISIDYDPVDADYVRNDIARRKMYEELEKKREELKKEREKSK